MNWLRFSNPIRGGVCTPGPDVVLHASADQLVAESWGLQSNPREQITYPAALEGEWADLYVRTALIRPSGWREGSRGPVVKSSAKAAEILAHLALLDHERVVMLLLDQSWKLMAIHEASVGGLHGCALTPKDVVRVSTLVGASRVIMAHNHPSGDPTPSRDDVRMTQAASEAFAATGVGLVDHLTLTRAAGHRSVVDYSSNIGEYNIRAERFPPGADRIVSVSPTPSEQLALAPYGKLAKFVVRTALIESPGREGQRRPDVSSFDAAVRVPAVQALAIETEERLITLCLDGRNGLMALHVLQGGVHGVAARSVYAVASTVPSSAIILAHNHPEKGEKLPMDLAMTTDIRDGLKAIGVPLLDHVVVEYGGKTSSMREAGAL